MPTTPKTIIALDVGEKRVGVAVASDIARLPNPLTTLYRGDKFLEELQELINEQDASIIVVGLPRGIEGQTTGQTETTQEFVDNLSEVTDLPIHLQDEATTSIHATEELEARGKAYTKADIDALAATYILEDYLAETAGREEPL